MDKFKNKKTKLHLDPFSNFKIHPKAKFETHLLIGRVWIFLFFLIKKERKGQIRSPDLIS